MGNEKTSKNQRSSILTLAKARELLVALPEDGRVANITLTPGGLTKIHVTARLAYRTEGYTGKVMTGGCVITARGPARSSGIPAREISSRMAPGWNPATFIRRAQTVMLASITQAHRESLEDSTSAAVDRHLDADPAKRNERLAAIETFCTQQGIPYEYDRMSEEQMSLVSIYLENAK